MGVIKGDDVTTVKVGATLSVTLLVVDSEGLELLEEATDNVGDTEGVVEREGEIEGEALEDCWPLPVPPPKSVKEGCPLEVRETDEEVEGE